MERVIMDARAREGEKVSEYQREEEELQEGGRKRARASEEDLRKRERKRGRESWRSKWSLERGKPLEFN